MLTHPRINTPPNASCVTFFNFALSDSTIGNTNVQVKRKISVIQKGISSLLIGAAGAGRAALAIAGVGVCFGATTNAGFSCST